jgi:hypothetical protein
MKKLITFIVMTCLLSACGTAPSPSATPIRSSVSNPLDAPVPTIRASASPSVVVRESATESVYPSTTPNPLSASPTIRASVSPSVDESASTDWKTLPIIPNVDPSIRAIYEYGISRGNDPHSFSIFGDCQARPEEFFGVFETDEDVVQDLSPELSEVVANFEGSFNRESPTAQDGTTPGSLLWIQWHRGEYGCTFSETPVECELRIHNPSFVIIQIGTHFESRNIDYLRRVITQLIDAGVVPILATKADNRELDERVNRDMVMLASEYDLPLWNFWAAVSDLPNRGLYTRDDRPLQGDIYLTEEAAERHRMTGLEALNAVWRVATGK